uniref:Uncharacterized protein n=1 Tax=Panagrolaimus superbus TaxID=310955 RepID=A0A914Y6H0_9BILA
MDIILIDRGYAFPDRYGNGLKLCYGENGKVQKIGEFTQAVCCDINLSKGDEMAPSEFYEDFTEIKNEV